MRVLNWPTIWPIYVTPRYNLHRCCCAERAAGAGAAADEAGDLKYEGGAVITPRAQAPSPSRSESSLIGVGNSMHNI
jgi:hypothetical protein